MWSLSSILSSRAPSPWASCRDYGRIKSVLSNLEENVKCCYYQRFVPNILNHYFHHCNHYNGTREYFWTLVIYSCPAGLSTYLIKVFADRRAAAKRSTTNVNNLYQSVTNTCKTEIYIFIDLYIAIFYTTYCK